MSLASFLQSGVESVTGSFRKSLRASGTDKMVPFNGTCAELIVHAGYQSFLINEVISISYSAFRQKAPVRILGQATPKAYAKGTRTVAGSIVLLCGRNHPFLRFLAPSGGDLAPYGSPVLTDQIPPFNIQVRLSSEDDVIGDPNVREKLPLINASVHDNPPSSIYLYGVELLSDSCVVSVDDLIIEVVLNYVALGYSVMKTDLVGNMIGPSLDVTDTIANGLKTRDSRYYTNTYTSPSTEKITMDTTADPNFVGSPAPWETEVEPIEPGANRNDVTHVASPIVQTIQD